MKRLTLFFILALITLTANSQNLLVNPSFETWSAGAPTGWTLGITGTSTQSSNTSTGSGSSIQATYNNGTYMISQNVVPPNGATTFDTNTLYKLSITYLVTVGDGTDARVWCGFITSAVGAPTTTYYSCPATNADSVLYWYPLHGPNTFASGLGTTGYLTDNRTSGTWNTYTCNFKFPAGVTQFNFSVRNYIGSTVIWDDFFFGIASTDPNIQTTPSQLNGFTYDKGAGPSSEQTFSVVGSYLTSNITITPPTNFQISKTSGSGFANLPITLTQSGGSVGSTLIYVRQKAGLNFGNYADSLILSSTGAPTRKVYCSGTVVGPTITPSITTLSNLNYNKGSGPSAEQSFSLTGAVLESDVTITPSSNLQISKTSGSGFVTTPITLTQSTGNVASSNIYVRLKAGLNYANYTDSLVITSTNATTKKVICSGTVVGPTITSTLSALNFLSYVAGTGPSATRIFGLSGSLLEDNLVVTPSVNYEISINGSTFSSTQITLTPTNGTLSNTTIYVRLKAGVSAGTYIENINLSSTGAVTKSIACSCIVLGPKITVSTTTVSGLNYSFDNGPSDQQSLTVSGSDLTSNIVITPNSNFQISTISGGSFTSSAMTLTQSGGIVNSSTIYVRLKAGLAAGNYSGNVILTSTSAETKTIACSGTVDNGTGLTYSVTVPVGTLACYIAGTMNSWIPLAMTKTDATHYYVTIPTATLTDTYKYYSGPNVSYIEKDGVGVDIPNRAYTVNDVVAAWAAIHDPTPYYNITLQIGANGILKENNINLSNGGTVSVASGGTKTFTFFPTAGYEVSTLTLGGIDVKAQLVSNQYSTSAISGNTTLSVTFQKIQYLISLKDAASGSMSLVCEYGATPSFKFTPDAGWKVNTVTFNGVDVTNILINGVYSVPSITENALLNVSFVTDIPNGSPELINNNLKVYTTQSDIIIEGTSTGETIGLYTLNGKQIQSIKSQGERIVIPAQKDAVYLIKTENKAFKVIL